MASALLGLLSTISGPTPARDAPPEAHSFNEAANRLFNASKASGIVVVWVKKGQSHFAGLGRQRGNSSGAPSKTTLLRLGSLSKLLAGDVLAHLVVKRDLSLDDPLQAFAPIGYRVPGGAAVTLRQLVTHTSGLPRQAPTNGNETAPPFTTPNHDQRWKALQHIQLISPPGTSALYSNLAFDLLGDAMSVAAQRPYPSLLRDMVTKPLGMRDTTATPDAEQCNRLMRAAMPTIANACTDTRATETSGGMYSTARDMALWMQAMLSPKRSPAERLSMQMLVRRSQLRTVEGLDIAGQANAIGMAWVQQDATAYHPRILEKTGGGGGFMSYIALSPDHSEGIFVCFDRLDIDALRRVAGLANSFLAAE